MHCSWMTCWSKLFPAICYFPTPFPTPQPYSSCRTLPEWNVTSCSNGNRKVGSAPGEVRRWGLGGKEERDILKINIRGEAHTEARVLEWVGGWGSFEDKSLELGFGFQDEESHV